MKKSIILITLVSSVIIGTSVGIFQVRSSQIAKNLEVAKQKRQDVSVTIVEGKRREEIADILESAGICTADAFLTASAGKEGTLFPDTYRFFPNTPATEVVESLTSNFTRRTKGLTFTDDDIILASIIEREARNDDERATISGVYTNRLKIGMKLDADPTVQYAKDTSEAKQVRNFSYWGKITRADYRNVISPYNTYLGPGLPPGPIANPGTKSLIAALNPEKHSFLFFAHRDGKLLLSKTLAEHESKL